MSEDSELIDKIEKQRIRGCSYETIGKMADVSGALIWKITQGKCSSPTVRAYFGLAPKMVMIEPCMCGEVHVKKSCPHTRPKRRYRVALEFLSKDEQQKMISLLAEFGPIRTWQSEVLLRLLDTDAILKD